MKPTHAMTENSKETNHQHKLESSFDADLKETSHGTHMSFKNLASLGDQKYPTYELKHAFDELRSQQLTQWCDELENELELKDWLDSEYMPSHLALEGVKRITSEQFEIGLGVRIADRYSLSDFGMLGVALVNARSLYEALQIALGFYELIGSFSDLTLIRDETSFTNRLVNVSGLNDELMHFIFELTFSGMVSMGREIAQRDIKTQTLRFRKKLSEQQRTFFAQRFNCTVEDEANFNEWVVDLADLKKPIICASLNKSELEQSIASLNALMDTLKQEFALVDKFDRLARSNDEEFANAKEIASALFMSERTFRRKLGKIGVNYNMLMGKIRCQIAIAMLQGGEHTNEDIAFELGFSDAANFCNAFKKWTGHTPNFYRP